MPVKPLPEILDVGSAISASHWTVDEAVDFDARYKSPWIHGIGLNPLLLQEPSLSSTDNPFSLVEEAFRDFGWITADYVKMGSERFMMKYCWS